MRSSVPFSQTLTSLASSSGPITVGEAAIAAFIALRSSSRTQPSPFASKAWTRDSAVGRKATNVVAIGPLMSKACIE
jgi:hypothetical protein